MRPKAAAVRYAHREKQPGATIKAVFLQKLDTLQESSLVLTDACTVKLSNDLSSSSLSEPDVNGDIRASSFGLSGTASNTNLLRFQSASLGSQFRSNSKRNSSNNGGNSVANNSAIRENQRQFLAQRLAILRKMSPKIYADCFVQPALQYFLASLCDVQVSPEERQRLGVRYPQTPEVRKLLKKLQEEKPISATGFQLNALLSALKEILGAFPGGIFVDISEEFYQISVNSRLQITVVYLHGLLEALPFFLRQFVYLICRSLRNVVSQCSGTLVDSYTDLLLMFTPVLFPSSVGDLDRFLRAARLTLVMVDCCEQVFQPVVWLDRNNNAWKPLSEEESFFYQILASLGRLEATLNDDSDDEINGNGSDCEAVDGAQAVKPVNQNFYQFAYLENN